MTETHWLYANVLFAAVYEGEHCIVVTWVHRTTIIRMHLLLLLIQWHEFNCVNSRFSWKSSSESNSVCVSHPMTHVHHKIKTSGRWSEEHWWSGYSVSGLEAVGMAYMWQKVNSQFLKSMLEHKIWNTLKEPNSEGRAIEHNVSCGEFLVYSEQNLPIVDHQTNNMGTRSSLVCGTEVYIYWVYISGKSYIHSTIHSGM